MPPNTDFAVTPDDIRNLLQQALYRIPLIPWSLVVDTWRWHVFEGRIKYEDWNTHWWHLRESLQGVKSPVPRCEMSIRYDSSDIMTRS